MSDVDRMHNGAFDVRRPENATEVTEAIQRQGAFTQASELRARVERLTATVDDVVAQRDDLAKRLGATQLRLGVVLNEKGDLEEALSSARARIAELEGLNEALSCDLIEAKVRVEELQERGVDLNRVAVGREVVLEKRIAELEGREDQLKARIVEYRDGNHAYAEHNMELIRAGVVKDQRIAELEAERGKLLDERSAGDAVVLSLKTQTEDARRLLQDQGCTIVHAQSENRAIRSLVDLTRAAFKEYGGDDQEWDGDTPGELLTVWDQFVEIFERLS